MIAAPTIVAMDTSGRLPRTSCPLKTEARNARARPARPEFEELANDSSRRMAPG